MFARQVTLFLLSCHTVKGPVIYVYLVDYRASRGSLKSPGIKDSLFMTRIYDIELWLTF